MDWIAAAFAQVYHLTPAVSCTMDRTMNAVQVVNTDLHSAGFHPIRRPDIV